MVLSVWSVLGCHSVVRLVRFGLSWCCLFGRFWVVIVLSAWSAWVVMVLSAWAILGCHGVVRLVCMGDFGLSWCCLLGRFWAVMVLSVCFGLSWCCLFGRMFVVTVLFAWAVLGCHGVVCLVGFGLLWCWSALVVLGCHGIVYLINFRFAYFYFSIKIWYYCSTSPPFHAF